MRSRLRPLVLGLMLATVPIGAVVAAVNVEQILLDKANYWRLKDRPDLAIEALTKLLFIDPNSVDGLYQLGLLEVQQGKIPDARKYLARLQTVAPNNPHVTELENTIRAGRVEPSELNEARRLAQSGQLTEAIKKYNETFHGPPPPGYGGEYYLTLSGTPGGWEQAKDGLQQLVNASPDDKSLRLALDQVLINRQTTRPQGVADLIKLSHDLVVGGDAVKLWRQALLWGAAPESYKAYLAQFPQDQEVRQREADITAQSGGGPGGQAQSQAYVDLQHGRVAAAEKRFSADLHSNPNDPQALGGMGLVRLRQQRFAEARALLGRAMKADPAHRSQWAAAYDSAAFWATVQEAKALQASGSLQRARAILERLLAHSRPRGSAGAEMVLANIDRRLNDNAAAERAYRRVLAVEPRNGDALIGLAGVLTAEGKTAEANEIARRMTPAERKRLASGGGGGLGQRFVKEAKDAEANGKNNIADAKFRQAIAAEPRDPWIRLEYARFLAGEGHGDQGYAVVDPQATGNTPTSVMVAAMYDVQQDHWAEALDLVDAMPPSQRSKDLNNFRDRILSRATEDRAKRLVKAGRRDEARQILVALYNNPNVRPDERRVAVYDLYQLGYHDTALQLSRDAMARGGPAGVKAGVDYAKLLVTAGRYADAAAVVRQLEARGRLGSDDRDDLLSVKALLASREVDKLLAAGHVARAYDAISPLLVARPDDPIVLMAVGRIYAAGNRNREALGYFDKAYKQDPSNIDILRGVVMGTIQADDLDQAEKYLSEGEKAHPKNPWIFFLKGQIEHARGYNWAALRDLRTAREMAQAQRLTAPSKSAPLQPKLPPNPFRS